MAYRNYRKSGRKRRSNYGRKKTRFTEQEKIAYRLGQVKRGLQNPNSRISESYKNGLTERQHMPKKSLY